MDSKMKEAIAKYNMLQYGDTVIAGVSGGADSMCLLHFLCVLRQEYGLNVIAAHVNHHLRAEESDRDESFVRTWCSTHGVPLSVFQADIYGMAKERGESIELCARQVRYMFFDSLAKQHDGKIATAHTLSDSIETMLFHLARGTGIKGMCGIPPVRGNIIRPLILLTGKQTRDYCKTHGVAYVVDSSNQEDTYTRNRLRHYVVPVLA